MPERIGLRFGREKDQIEKGKRKGEYHNPFRDPNVEMEENYKNTVPRTQIHEESDRDERVSWWDVRYWGWKGFAILGAVIAVVIVAIVVPVVVTKKDSRYPNYTKLTYTLRDTCTSSLIPLMFQGS